VVEEVVSEIGGALVVDVVVEVVVDVLPVVLPQDASSTAATTSKLTPSKRTLCFNFSFFPSIFLFFVTTKELILSALLDFKLYHVG
jgi:hypothetical protein